MTSRPTTRTTTYAALLAATLTTGLTAGLVAPASAMRGDDLGRAVSQTKQDSVYPKVGHPGVDALHYDLHLGWAPSTTTLTGDETLTFRATRTAKSFALDLSPTMKVATASLGGSPVTTRHPGKNLVVTSPIVKNHRYVLRLGYAGIPTPVKAPTTRDDVENGGLTPTDDGSAWTIQEPYGAYTWYAVDDQPADKAFYDFELGVPAPMTGIANGTLLSSRLVDGTRITRWHLGDPASSYLSTVAFGRYTIAHKRSASGVPFTFATPTGRPGIAKRIAFAAQGLSWLESKLGRYPFHSLGAVVVPSTSAEETETMMTIGNQSGDMNKSTLIHEMAHQWYGDEVTPRDWIDLWMNEGMATYIEALWQASHQPKAYGSLPDIMDQYAKWDRFERIEYGPAAHYHPGDFASSNVYYGPAVMWDQLRKKLGDKVFFAMVKKWPTVHAYAGSDRLGYTRWIARETHTDLTSFFHGWLLSKTQPKLH